MTTLAWKISESDPTSGMTDKNIDAGDQSCKELIINQNLLIVLF